MKSDLREALFLVWLALSAIGAAAVTAPWVLGPERAQRVMPVCESVARGAGPCAACGLTTGFIAISQARFADAWESHRMVIPIYSLFVINLPIAFGALARRRSRGEAVCRS
jgi:hypothetical protein